MRVLERITAPTTEPMTTAELKEYLASEVDPSKLVNVLAGARAIAERYTRRSIMAQEWRASWEFGDVPRLGRVVKLPRGPVSGVNKVGVLTVTGTVTPMEDGSSVFRSGRDELALVAGASWPWPGEAELLVVDYEAGAVTADKVDPELLRVVQEVAAYLWRWRGEGFVKGMGEAAVTDSGLQAVLGKFAHLRPASAYL